MTGAFNRRSASAAAKANAFLDNPRRDFQARVGGVNRFWQEGGAPQVPFPTAPRAARGVTSNRQAPSATTLYPDPPAVSNYARARDAAVVGLGGGEVAVTTYMQNQAHEELNQAREAVSADPSEANIQRLQAAEGRAALWEGAANIGRGFIGGYVLGAPFHRYQSTRPDVAAAEAERLRLDALVKSGRRKPRTP